MTTILIVDDEPGLRDLLVDAFAMEGFETKTAANGAEGLDALRRGEVTLCVVDVNMPNVNGFEFLRRLREHDARTPVVMLSARNDPIDVASGLRFGADDYVRKPFSVEELVLRVRAVLRRSQGQVDDEEEIVAGALRLNLDRHDCYVRGELVDLSATEFRLLEALLRRVDRVLTREQLLREVWNINFDSDTSVLDTYVSYLRRKVHRDDFAPITTVRGVGFKFVTMS